MAPQVDVAVVGAGIIGCLTAREILARAPGLSVAVLDRDLAGGGASRRSAGLHIPRGGTERVRRMTQYSQDFYQQLVHDRPSLPIRRVGMTVLSRSAELVHERYLDSAKAARTDRMPGGPAALPQGAGAWQVEGAQYADVPALTRTLLGLLRPQAQVRESVAVTAVRPGPGAVALDLGSGGELTAGQVVLAPGPWLAAPAWRELVAPLGARVKKVVALHVEQRPGPADRALVWEDEDAFLLPVHDRGHWLFSYTCQDWDVDPDGLTGGLTARDLRTALDALRRVAPAFAEHCDSGRVFCDAYSVTREPLVRTLPADPRLVFAGAANGSGYRLAPAIAAEAADLLTLPATPRSST